MRKTLLLFFLFLNISCNQQVLVEEKTGVVAYSVKGEHFSLSLDGQTPSNLMYVQYNNEGGTRKLRLFNNYGNALQEYDIDQDKLLRKVEYQKEGPDAVLEVSGFLYLNDDSIFYIRRDKHITLANARGKVLDDFFPKEKPYLFRPVGWSSSQPYWVDGHLYFSNVGMPLQVNTDVNPFRRVQSLERAYIPEEKEMIAFQVDNPEYLKADQGRIMLHNFSRCFDGERFVYLWHKVPLLYLMHKDSAGLHASVPLQSQHLEKDFNAYFLGDLQDAQASWEHLASKSTFSSISYDPYRDLYYVIALQKVPKEYIENKPSTIPHTHLRKMVVMVLDKDLRVKKELVLPAKTYNPYLFFVAEDGFYLSLNNLMNPEVGEDELAFGKIDLGLEGNVKR